MLVGSDSTAPNGITTTPRVKACDRCSFLVSFSSRTIHKYYLPLAYRA